MRMREPVLLRMWKQEFGSYTRGNVQSDLIAGLQPQVARILERSGLMDALGPDRFFWSADQAILAASEFDDLPLGVVPVK